MSAAGLVSGEREGKFRPWLECIERSVETAYPGIRYVTVARKQLVGMLLVVSVREDLSSFVSDVQIATAGTGLMGVMGNKGGIAVSIRVYDTTICFVNSHLAAGSSHIERRNQDYGEIGRRIQFGVQDAPTLSAAPEAGQIRSIFDHDYVFWIGDLNYRLSNSLGYKRVADVSNRCDRAEMARLLAHDQLVQQRALGTVFQGFTEPPLTFPCTYKYSPGTDNYCPFDPDHLRLPAWCDRIMWRVRARDGCSGVPGLIRNGYPQSVEAYLARFRLYPTGQATMQRARLIDTSRPPRESPFGQQWERASDTDTCDFSVMDRSVFPTAPRLLSPCAPHGEAVECLQYAALDAPTLWQSDHHPVRGVFLMRARATDLERRGRLRAELTAQVEASVQQQPFVELSTKELSFGRLEAGVPSRLTLALSNTGTLPASFSFVSKPQGEPLPSWLSVSALQGILAPGKRMDLNFTALVDDTMAAELNLGAITLDDILVLRLQGGCDHYISVSGEWVPGCFGADLGALVEETCAADPAAHIPLQLWWLGEFIWQLGDGLDTPELFVRAGPDEQVQDLRAALQGGPSEVDAQCRALYERARAENWTPLAAATVLLHFIGSLRDPIWPSQHYRAAVTAGSASSCRQLVDQTPLRTANYSILLYLIVLLRDVARRKDRNGLPADQLAMIFAPVVLRPPPQQPAEPLRATSFLQALLSN